MITTDIDFAPIAAQVRQVEDIVDQVKQWDAECVDADKAGKKASMRLGWYGYKIKQANRFGVLGCGTEDDYWELRGFKRSTWYRATAIASQFQNIPLDKFMSMTLDNAEILIERVPETERQKAYWIREASKNSAAELIEVIGEKFPYEDKESKPRNKEFSNLKIPCLTAKKDHILEGLDEFQAKHGLSSVSQALEMLVTEYTGRTTFVGFISDQLPVLQEALKKEGSVEEVAEALRTALEGHVLGLANVLSSKTGKTLEAA